MVMRMDSVFLPVLDVQGSTPVTGDISQYLETINTSPVDAAKIKWGGSPRSSAFPNSAVSSSRMAFRNIRRGPEELLY